MDGTTIVDDPYLDATNALEHAVERALRSASVRELDVLGYGEISCVLAWRGRAHKRLPPFAEAARATAYGDAIADYVERLRARGVRVVESRVVVRRNAAGGAVAHCVQPILAPESVLPRVLARCSAREAAGLFGRVVETVGACVQPELGLDAQLSNWAISTSGELVYLDVTTPLVRAPDGVNLLDVEVFLAALPRSARGLVRTFLVTAVLDKYFSPRAVLLDLLGNLYNQGLAQSVGPWLEIANAHLEDPLTRGEVYRTHLADTATWLVVHRLLAFERWWSRSVLGKPYPVLLPDRLG